MTLSETMQLPAVDGKFHQPSPAEYLTHAKKAEELIRMGLLPLATIPYVKRALMHMQQDMFLPWQERHVFYDFIRQVLSLVFDDKLLNRLAKQKTMLHKYEQTNPMQEKVFMQTIYVRRDVLESIESTPRKEMISEISRAAKNAYIRAASKDMVKQSHREKDYQKAAQVKANTHTGEVFRKASVKASERYAKRVKGIDVATRKEETIIEGRPRILALSGPNVRKAPQGSLIAMANSVAAKQKAGGKISDNDKSLAARARNELRRRRQLGTTTSEDTQLDELSKEETIVVETSLKLKIAAFKAQKDPVKKEKTLQHIRAAHDQKYIKRMKGRAKEVFTHLHTEDTQLDELSPGLLSHYKTAANYDVGQKEMERGDRHGPRKGSKRRIKLDAKIVKRHKKLGDANMKLKAKLGEPEHGHHWSDPRVNDAHKAGIAHRKKHKLPMPTKYKYYNADGSLHHHYDESYEQEGSLPRIVETSKQKLHRYIHAALNDKSDADYHAGTITGKQMAGRPDDDEVHSAAADRFKRGSVNTMLTRAEKRGRGIRQAVKKLSK